MATRKHPPVARTSPLVLLDPGHGPNCKNPGAKGEWQLNWTICSATAQLMPGLVELTKTNSIASPSLIERVHHEHSLRPDLFVSVPCNYHRNAAVQGIETFCASDRAEIAANCVHAALLQAVSARDRKVKRVDQNTDTFDDYFVLLKTKSPAVLVELGFLSNPDENTALHNLDYQKLLVGGLVRGMTSAIRALGLVTDYEDAQAPV
jgi:N-acetylmuramoyl-L-alanine amidase